MRVQKQRTKLSSVKNGSKLSYLEIAKMGGQAIDNITKIIHTIGEERQKTEELKLEQHRISCELEAKISETENKTIQLLGQYQIELSKISSEIRLAEIEAQKVIAAGQNAHEERMLSIKIEHERRMRQFDRQFDLIEKIIDAALQQYNSYIYITPSEPGATPLINLQMLDAMISTIQHLMRYCSEPVLMRQHYGLPSEEII